MSLFVTVTNGNEQRLCEVTNLFDVDGNDTTDADTARKAVIKWDDEHWLACAPGEPISHFTVRPS